MRRLLSASALILLTVGCSDEPRAISYTELVEDVRAGRAERLEACVGQDSTRYRYEREGADGDGPERLTALGFPDHEALAREAVTHGVRFEVVAEGCD